jgi:hypothetical protein
MADGSDEGSDPNVSTTSRPTGDHDIVKVVQATL